MGDCHCNLFDKTIILKHKKKHLKTESYMNFADSKDNKYSVKNPEFIEIEKTLQKHVNNYNKNLNFTIIFVSGNYSLLILLFMLNLGECIVIVHVVR